MMNHKEEKDNIKMVTNDTDSVQVKKFLNTYIAKDELLISHRIFHCIYKY